jgi:cell division protein FtsL
MEGGMIQILNGLLVLAVLVCGGWVYSLEYKSRILDKRTAAIQRSIEDEREAIRMLDAEWGHLNTPARLETLARNHLDLAPTDVANILRPSQIAAKVPALEGRRLAGGGDPIGDILIGKIDPTAAAVKGEAPTDPIANILKGLQ